MISPNSSSVNAITFPASSNSIYGVASLCLAGSSTVSQIDFNNNATNICDGAFTRLNNLSQISNAANILFTDEITVKSQTDD
jgi:hypothetical protein